MNNKLLEACYSFVALYMLACGIAACIVLGILLAPVVLMLVFILAIREAVIWRKKTKPAGKGSAHVIIADYSASVKPLLPYKPHRTAA